MVKMTKIIVTTEITTNDEYCSVNCHFRTVDQCILFNAYVPKFKRCEKCLNAKEVEEFNLSSADLDFRDKNGAKL